MIFWGVNGFVLLLWRKGLWLGFSFSRVFRGRRLGGHFSVQLEEFFEAFGVVFEAATDVDEFENFVACDRGFC
jgi:hypothetical protein